jgi:hypothetical protein
MDGHNYPFGSPGLLSPNPAKLPLARPVDGRDGTVACLGPIQMARPAVIAADESPNGPIEGSATHSQAG